MSNWEITERGITDDICETYGDLYVDEYFDVDELKEKASECANMDEFEEWFVENHQYDVEDAIISYFENMAQDFSSYSTSLAMAEYFYNKFA